MRSRGAAQRVALELAGRLRSKRSEIEEAVLARVFAVTDPAASTDPSYLDGLRGAVTSALDCAIAAIDGTEPQPVPIPAELLTQARQAARSDVGLEVVLRRYFAGYTLLSDFLIKEVEAGDLLGAEEFHRLSRAQAELFDRMIDAVSTEHRRESEARSRSRHQRRVECVEQLLDGELADTSELDYDLHAWHLGLVAQGTGMGEAIRDLAERLDRRPLVLPRGEGIVWAWYGGRREIDPAELQHIVPSSWSAQASLAIGEPGRGVSGWRLTHRQAAAALPIALRTTEPIVRYRDVSLLASMLQDEVLRTSLRGLYLAPLARERDGGRTLRQTLRAYFAAARNISSAAAALKVTRHTVANRLRSVETHLDRPLDICTVELEAALRLYEIEKPAVQ